MNKFIKRLTSPLIIFCVVTLGGFASLMLKGEKFWLSKIYAALDVSSAVALAILAFMVYFKYGRQLEPIKISIEKVHTEEPREDIPITILRKNFTRSELFGVLGAIEKNGKFQIAYTSTPEFFKDLEDIQEGKKDSMVIKINETDTFNLTTCYTQN